MRGSKSAPSFDGKPGHLLRYLRDVQETGEDTERTTDDELIDIALRYLNIDDEELWKRKRTAIMTFDQFKKEIMKLYPGSNGDKLYAWSDLREVVRKGQEKPPSNKDDFGEYQRNFTRIADFLKSKDKISERERDEQFMRGIHADFRFRVLQRLQIMKPGQASDTPYGIEDVIEAAEWAIDGTPGQFYQDTEEDTTVIKKEMVEMTASMREMRTALAGLTRQVDFPRQRQPEPRAAYQNQQQDRGPYLRNQEQGRWNTENPRPLAPQGQAYREAQVPMDNNQTRGPGGAFEEGKCGFCSNDGHYMRECPKIEEYIQKGMCKRNQANKIVLPNGYFLPRAITGRNFIERIDKWHKMQGPETPLATANMYERERPPHMLYMASTVSDTDEIEETTSTETYAYQEPGDLSLRELSNDEIEIYLETRKKAEGRGKAKEVFDSVQMPPRPPPTGRRKVGFAQPEVEGTAGRLPKASTTPPATTQKPVSTPPTGAPTPFNGPKIFVPKYRAAIEDSVITAEMVDRALDNKFMISTREFFAVCADGRKYMKDLLISKKLPNVEVAYTDAGFGQPSEPQYILRYEENNGVTHEEKLTSSEIDALRVVDPIVHDTLRIEGILDQGSEIVAMNRDVWLKLGVGLDPEKILNMQSANSQSSSTVGVIEDLKFNFNGIEVPLQVHVVQGAPFDLLIGRPFFRFTSCKTTDNTDGSQEITITCPNTGRRVTIPTRKKTNKSRNPFRDEGKSASGFHRAGPRL